VSFIDSTGRVYSVPAHSLPSARGQGEPLTGRLTPPQGASFVAALGGDPDKWYLLASDAGYGFVVRLGDVYSKNKAGKALLSLPKGACVLSPAVVNDPASDRVVAVTNEGRILVFPVSDLPVMGRGKGNKIIGIPTQRVAAREEFVVAIRSVPVDGRLRIHSGKRYLTLKPADLEHYSGERGRRGSKLPRGYQRVERLEVE
jgi:topoisomerase-4 subunit A